MQYTLRPSKQDDFEFVFQLKDEHAQIRRATARGGRRRDIGTASIRDIGAEAQRYQVPITLMVLQINPVKWLYERLGFRTVEEVDTGFTGVKYRMTTAAL